MHVIATCVFVATSLDQRWCLGTLKTYTIFSQLIQDKIAGKLKYFFKI